MAASIGIIATLDTKGDEAKFLKEYIENKGFKTVVIDPGVMGEPFFKPDITREEVAKEGGKNIQKLIDDANKGKDRGVINQTMITGLSTIVIDLYKNKKISGIIGIGGGTGAILCSEAMKKLPIGFPKLIVTTHPQSNHFGIKDITMTQSVVDLVGLNTIIKRVLINAANAITAMAEYGEELKVGPKPIVGITCWGIVTPAAMKIVTMLEDKGFEPLLVHSTTEPLEDMIENENIHAVIDLCANELIDLYIYPTKVSQVGIGKLRKDRLESAGKKGLPIIFTPGTLDGAFFPLDDERYKNRKTIKHVEGWYLVRTTAEELKKLGKVIAEKANKSTGSVSIIIPKHGLSENDKEHRPFYDPRAIDAFTKSLKENVKESVRVVEIESHINSELYAKSVVDILDEMINL